eukprot:9561910-Karenia_brevis.AAC.1
MGGSLAVGEAWDMTCAGMRSLGITSKTDLVDWLARNGHGRVAPGGYLTALAQVALLWETHVAIHGAVQDCAAPALEDVYVGVAMHLAQRGDLDQIVADAQSLHRRQGVTRQRRQRTARLSTRPAE